jgi:hypothetical protein
MEFPEFHRVYFHNLFIIYQALFFSSENPCPFASPAFEVTPSGLAGWEYLPLPASKGLAFPFLLTLDGYPTSPAIYAQGQGFSPEIKESPGQQTMLTNRSVSFNKGRAFTLSRGAAYFFC